MRYLKLVTWGTVQYSEYTSHENVRTVKYKLHVPYVMYSTYVPPFSDFEFLIATLYCIIVMASVLHDGTS